MTDLIRDLEAVAWESFLSSLRPSERATAEGSASRGESLTHKAFEAGLRAHHAEIAEALKDARRWRVLKGDSFSGCDLLLKRLYHLDTPHWDSAIDTAMRNSEREDESHD